MLSIIIRNWWTLALRGLVAVLFGLAAFLWPGITVHVLVLFFGIFALLDGVFTLIAAVRARKVYDRWWVFLLQGLLSVGAGIIAFVWPAITALALLFVIALWAVATGMVEVALAVSLRKELEHEWLLMLSGAFSVIFGVLLVAWPGSGILALIWLVGAYAIFVGVLLVSLGLRVRKLDKAFDRERRAEGLGTPDTLTANQAEGRTVGPAPYRAASTLT